jgi:hypothetical protein
MATRVINMVLLYSLVGNQLLSTLAFGQWYWQVDKFDRDHKTTVGGNPKWNAKLGKLVPGPHGIPLCARMLQKLKWWWMQLKFGQSLKASFTAIFTAYIKPRQRLSDGGQFLTLKIKNSNGYRIFAVNVMITQNNLAWFKINKDREHTKNGKYTHKTTMISIDLDPSIGPWHQFLISYQLNEVRCRVDDSQEKRITGSVQIQRRVRMRYVALEANLSMKNYDDYIRIAKLFLFDAVLNSRDQEFYKTWVSGL